MDPQAKRTRWFHALVAVLLPALLVAGWLQLVTSLEDDRESSFAGLGSDTDPIDGDPEILLLGNSLTVRGVDPDLLARQLGARDAAVLRYTGSWAPTWYAALENKVFGHDKHPKLIVVVNTLESMLRTDPPFGLGAADLFGLMNEEEPVLQAKVFGNRTIGGPLETLNAQRGAVGEWVLDGFKAAPLAIAGSSDPDRAAAYAFSEVFERDGATDARLNRRVIPIVEIERARTRGQTDPARSLVPDLIDLADQHGARIVFARIPVSRAGRVEHPISPLDVERRAVALLNQRGAGYVDLHGQQFPDSYFLDDVHLNWQGRRAYTQALSQALIAMGALSDQPMPAAELPPWPPEIRRTGRPPALPELGTGGAISGCRVSYRLTHFGAISDAHLEALGVGPVSPLRLTLGDATLPPNGRPKLKDPCDPSAYHFERAIFGWSTDSERLEQPASLHWTEDLPVLSDEGDAAPAWWVYPGTELRFDFPEPEAGTESTRTVVEILALALGPGPAPTLEADGRIGFPRHKGLRNTANILLDHKPRQIAITAPEDGQFWLIRRLALREPDRVIHVIGNPEDQGTTVRLAGQALKDKPTVRAASNEHPLAHGRPVPPYDEITSWSIPVPTARQVSYSALMMRTGIIAFASDDPRANVAMEVVRRCSPVELWQDGVPMKRTALPFEFIPQTVGAYRHVGELVLFNPTDGSPEDHQYEVRLASDRTCRGHVWLYPDDDLVISNEAVRGQILSGADTLLLGGFAFGDRKDVNITVQVTSNQGLHLLTQVPIRRFEGEPAAFQLDRPLPPNPGHLEVRLSTADHDTYLLLNMVAVEDRSADGVSPEPR